MHTFPPSVPVLSYALLMAASRAGAADVDSGGGSLFDGPSFSLDQLVMAMARLPDRDESFTMQAGAADRTPVSQRRLSLQRL